MHTKGEWQITGSRGQRCIEAVQRPVGRGLERCQVVAHVYGLTDDEVEANLRRICACVNALDGIPTPVLEARAAELKATLPSQKGEKSDGQDA